MRDLRKPNRKLRALLREHKSWACGNLLCKPLDVRGTDLSWLDLRGRDLRGANMSRVDLTGACLVEANLKGANLSGANLHMVKLNDADMSHAILCRAFAAFVAFVRVDLTGVDFTGADLSGADWEKAKFGTDQESLFNLAKFNITPQGVIIGWKKLRDGKLAKLRIPEEAKRSSGFGRRCRAEYAEVLMIVDEGGEPHWEGVSKRDRNLKYVAKQVVTPSGYDPDWKNECAEGINFFLTREEAEMY